MDFFVKRTGSLRPRTFVTLLGLLYCTGLRVSETLGLRLADVDLEAGLRRPCRSG